jgi:hypothetical protein
MWGEAQRVAVLLDLARLRLRPNHDNRVMTSN